MQNTKNQLYYDMLITSNIRQIKALKNILIKAEAFGLEKNISTQEIFDYKLADDMFPFVAQIRNTLDNAKMGVLRAVGKDNIPHADNETEFIQLQDRADSVISILESIKPEDFEGIESRTVEFPWMPGVVLNMEKTIINMLIPNFYFHATTAYAILRSKGVNLGKADFIGWDFK